MKHEYQHNSLKKLNMTELAALGFVVNLCGREKAIETMTIETRTKEEATALVDDYISSLKENAVPA